MYKTYVRITSLHKFYVGELTINNIFRCRKNKQGITKIVALAVHIISRRMAFD